MLKAFLGASTALVPLWTAASAATTAATAQGEPNDDSYVVNDEIVVTATPIPKPVDELTAHVSVLDDADLQQQLRPTLGETLRREPGVSSTGFAPGSSRPIIRGLGGERVRTLTNGVGSIDAAASSPDHATPIEPSLAERIEVVRGPQLLRYGSSAAGGVVNVLDGRIVRETPEEKVGVSARSAYTTVDEGLEGSLFGSAVLGKLGGVDVVLTGSVAARDAGDIDIPGFAESAAFREMEEHEHDHHDDHHDDHDDHHDGHDDHEHGPEEEEEMRGTLENSFNEVLTYSGGLSFVGERGFLGFSVQRYENEYGVPAGHDHGHGHGEEHHEDDHHDDGHDDHHDDHHDDEHGHAHGEDGVFIDLEQTRFDVNGGLELGGFIDRVELFGGYADYEHTEFEGPGEAGTVFSNEGGEIRLEGIQQQVGNWRGASGFQYRTRDFSVVGEEAFVAPSETDQFGIYTFQELAFDRGSLEASLRYEHTEQRNQVENIDRSFDGISASLGGSFRPSEAVTLTGSVFRTERAPSTEDLFSNGPHLATQSFDVGDPDLGIETATGVEAAVRFGWESFRVTFTGFHTDYQDFIYQQVTGESGADFLMAMGETDAEELEEFGELDVLQYTGADATFTGFEIEAFADLGSWNGISFQSDLVVDYVDANLDEADATGSDQLPRIPPLGLIAGVQADAGMALLRAEVEYAAEADDVAAFELPTDSYTLVNLYGEWRVTDRLSFEVSGLNLFDQEARLHTSFIKDEVPLPGRNVRFALRYRY